MTTSFLLTRAHDHAVLGVRLDGFDITGGTATAGAGGGTIGLVLPPQHVLEDTLNPPFPDAVVLRAELSGLSLTTRETRLWHEIAAGNVPPFLRQLSNSEAFMRRDALAASGCCTPTPLHSSLRPPPVPVLSTFGVFRPEALPNCSATVEVNGNTVEEPTMLM